MTQNKYKILVVEDEENIANFVAALLEANGYSVCALELIDPEETPKNIMLRALRRSKFDPESAEARRLREEYDRAKTFLLGI